MTSIAYIVTNINKALAFEWTAMHLNPGRFRLIFILLNNGPSELESFCHEKSISCYRIPYKSKKSIPAAILKIYRILKKEKIDIVHAHLVDSGLTGIAAARLAGIKKRIYTRHHSSYHHEYYPHAVKYDRWINRNSTHLVAISKNVHDIMLKNENVPEAKITLIHHGFDLDAFQQVNESRVELLRKKYGLSDKSHPVIGVVSRYIELKGIQYIIPAFKQLLEKYPQAHLLLCNGNGNYTPEIKKLLKNLPGSSYTEIGFEYDNFALYKLFDVFVHVPVNSKIEAFGQIYVEALAAGIPSVFTLSGVAHEFARHQENCLVVDYRSAGQIHQSILTILHNTELRNKMIKNGMEDVKSLFSLSLMIQKLEKLYER